MRTSTLYRVLHNGSEIALGPNVKSRWSGFVEYGDRRLGGNLELQQRITYAGTPEELAEFKESLANPAAFAISTKLAIGNWETVAHVAF